MLQLALSNGVRMVLPGSRPAAASSWTAASSVSGRRWAVDLQLAGVDAGDQLGELGGVAAREHYTVRTPRPVSSRPGQVVLTKAPPSAVRSASRAVSSGLGAHQVEHHVEPLPGHRLRERGGGVVDDPVRAVGADPVALRALAVAVTVAPACWRAGRRTRRPRRPRR